VWLNLPIAERWAARVRFIVPEWQRCDGHREQRRFGLGSVAVELGPDVSFVRVAVIQTIGLLRRERKAALRSFNWMAALGR
tara:strand:- start:27441 stop:27683 length:243 start_codon:yes stop_codon:yes gene_type:complete